MLAAHSGERSGGASGRLRLRNAQGGWLLCRVTLQPLAGKTSGAFAFTLSPALQDASPQQVRTQELEEHLRRIAREISASGIAAWSMSMPTALEMPELSALTSREYEIVVRLTTGERVPAIARALFLSESTIRNHLTSVYRKIGVQSQGELLERLHRAG